MKRFLPSLRRLVGLGPKLRCWPGAVAQVVGGDCVASRLLAGRTVTVTSLRKNCNGEPAWEYEGPRFIVTVLRPVVVDCIPDAILRPITPPGDEVSDLEVKALFAPDATVVAPKERAHG
jgi:hypothetical protein